MAKSLIERYDLRASFEAAKKEKQAKLDDIKLRTKDATDEDLTALEEQATNLATEIKALFHSQSLLQQKA